MMAIISSGASVNAHLRILYPMPEAPGMEVFDVEVRVLRISCTVTGTNVWVFSFIPFHEKSPLRGFGGEKKLPCIISILSLGWTAVFPPSSVRTGENTLHFPLYQSFILQTLACVTLLASSMAPSLLDFRMDSLKEVVSLWKFALWEGHT